MAKANAVLGYKLLDSGKLEFTVLGEGGGLVTFDPSKASGKCASIAAIEGWKKRLGNTAAIDSEKKPNPAMRLERLRKLAEHYETGTEQWSPTREGGLQGPNLDTQLLIRAMEQLYPNAPEGRVVARVRGWTPEERMTASNQPNVKVILDALRAEAASGIDVEGLMAGLEDAEEEDAEEEDAE